MGLSAMTLVLVGCLLVALAGNGESSAIRCSPGNNDATCANIRLEEAPSPPEEISEEPELSLQVECLAGSEWNSNCHFCKCSDTGVAKCLKQEVCEDGVIGEPISCKPNTTFSRDCNTCACLENGHALCTIRYCRRSGIPKKSELLAGRECAPGSTWTSSCGECMCSDEGYGICDPVQCDERGDKLEMRCAPDTMWKNECNTCWCTAEGRAMCTKIGCEIINLSLDDSRKESEDKEPESKIKYSKINEIKKKIANIGHSLVKRSTCKPNEDFQLECNACKCSGDGQTYTCTQNECLERDMNKEVEVFMQNEGVDHIERHSVCQPRNTFYIGCNTCYCNYFGTDYSCTNKPCPLPEDVELFHELRITQSSKNELKEVVCVANRMFVKDCNNCWCNNDGTGYSCTRKVCIPEMLEDNNSTEEKINPVSKSNLNNTKVICVANQTFVHECNTCWCNDDGTSFSCTRKVCVPFLPDDLNIEDEKPEDLRILKKECRPNEVFELDCNMCRCNPDGKSFSCTRRACVDQEDEKNATLFRRKRAMSQEPPKACQPGQEFRLDCNKCLCDNEGQDYSCTRIDCNALNSNGGGRSKRDASDLAEISLDCVPGSVFQRDCNACRCTGDGKHAMCTTKSCQPLDSKRNPVENDARGADPDPGFRCNPGEQFKRECKDCTCSADGKSYFCTLQLCDEFLTPSI